VKFPRYSMMKHGKGLPTNVHLLHLHDEGEGTIIFRLANIFQASGKFEYLYPMYTLVTVFISCTYIL